MMSSAMILIGKPLEMAGFWEGSGTEGNSTKWELWKDERGERIVKWNGVRIEVAR